MVSSRVLRAWVTGSAMAFATAAFAGDEATTRPATEPTAAAATRPGTGDVAMTPDVAGQVAAVAKAYTGLKTLSVAGTIDTTAEVGGEKVSRHADFTGSFRAPLTFRHEVKGDVVAACDGHKVWVYLPEENVYTSDDAPADRGRLQDLPGDAGGLLATQDLSLALALTSDPGRDLTAGATAVSKAADVTINGVACPALALRFGDKGMTVVVDGTTHLIRRVVLDQGEALKSRGADVKTAVTTIDFARTAADADVKPESLAFAPPPTAQEQQASGGDASALEGKAVPAFKLKQTDGTEVSDSSLRGSVYVLDFWATWCGPCVESLPHLDELYKKQKDAGLKVFAVNQQEDAATVQAFIGRTHLSLPVLLDPDRKGGAAFGADAIPETVVVGRNGIVRKVFVGSGNEDGIAAEVDTALKGDHP